MSSVKAFVKKEAVFCIAALCAIITMFFVYPDSAYIEYIDLKVLCLLFCLMAVVEGFKSVGVFSCLTSSMLSKIKSGRILGIVLVLLPFFVSMLVTNDVALIVFIPFTILLLTELGFNKSVIPVTVLQTVSANLGSMATPVGNPQNLFLYSYYNMSAKDFFIIVLPIAAVSLVLLTPVSSLIVPAEMPAAGREKSGAKLSDKKRFILYIILFVLSLLEVFRVVHFALVTVAVIIVITVTGSELLKKVDYMLLLTFVCFFIISGNLGRIEAVSEFLRSLLNKNTMLTCIGASQIISNVPAAVLLSGFTEDFKAVLSGVNIGGLGTPVASLASLITLKFYMKEKNAKTIKFLAFFTVVNIVGLLALVLFASCLD